MGEPEWVDVTWRRAGPDHLDAAVSSVIGAILLAGLLVVVLITIQTSIVPVQEERSERAFMAQVRRQIGGIQANLDKHVAGGATGTLSGPVTLSRPSTGFFTSGSPDNSLEFTPGTTAVRVSSNQIRLVGVTAVEGGDVELDWVQVGGPDDGTGSATIDEVVSVQDFRTRIDCVGPCANQDDSFRIEVTDASGNFAGDLRVRQGAEGEGAQATNRFIEVRVRDRNNDVIFEQPIQHLGARDHRLFQVRVSDQDYRFDDVIRAAEKPLTFTIVENGFDVEYAIAYHVGDGSGPGIPAGAGSGAIVEPYHQTFSGGRLTYHALSDEFVDQTYVMTNGATILEQADGAVLENAIHTTVTKQGTRTEWTLNLPSLQGESFTLGGGDTATVNTRPTESTDIVAEAPRFSFNVTTDHPSLWAGHLRDKFEDAGLSSADGEFEITTGSDWTDATLYGTTTDPASTVLDNTIILRQAAIDVEGRG